MPKKDAETVLDNINYEPGPTGILPDKTPVTSQLNGELPIKNLSKTGRQAYGFQGITNCALLLVAFFCDDNCKVIFDKYKCQVIKDAKLILEVNAILRKDTATYKLANWYHAAIGFPSLTTLDLKKKNLHSFPAIDKINWKKHPKSVHTSKGHLKQECKNLQSTKIPVLSEIAPKQEEKTYNVFAVLDDFHKSSKAYTDLTGRFPFQSSQGNNYLFILYDYDGNAILAEPIKNRQTATIKAAWTKLHGRLKMSGDKPKLYIMDNECSAELQKALKEETCNFQLVPPHIHRRNAAERAISTFKDHFLAMLSSMNASFPISAWDYLIPQAELTLNLLRNARANLNLSSWEYHFATYNFNSTPIAQVGTKVLAHVKPQQCQSWVFHGEDAWYIGPFLNHYHCV